MRGHGLAHMDLIGAVIGKSTKPRRATLPNRIIRESCRTSRTLDELSDGAERLFWRLTTVADDFGRFEADPRIVLGHCFPLRIGKLSPVKVEGWITELVQMNIIQMYTAHGPNIYAQFVTWDEHQTKRARHSKFPEPVSICAQVQTSASKCEQMSPRNEKRGTRSEESRNEDTLTAPTGDGEPFERFWTAYPRKVGKARAEGAWQKIKPPLDAVLAALTWQIKSADWTKDNGEFVPYPATYLNQHRWKDEPYAPKGVRDDRRFKHKARAALEELANEFEEKGPSHGSGGADLCIPESGS